VKQLSYFFFYTYVGLVLLAGAWGAFIGPHRDFIWLFGLHTDTLPEQSSINLVSQYRFLRALEFGYGLYSVIFLREIFSERKFNALFLMIMFSGVLSRIVSIVVEGSPSPLFYFFLIYELTGVVIIFLYTRSKIYTHVSH